MIERFIYFIRYFLFWISFFIFLRLVFLFYYFNQSFGLLNDWCGIFLHGLRLDLSITGYLSIFPLLMLGLSGMAKPKWPIKAIKIYSFTLFGIVSLFCASDLALFNEWGYRMDATPLLYLANPKDALTSVTILFIAVHLLIAITVFGLAAFGFNSFLLKHLKPGKRPILTCFLLLITAGSMIIPIRGGFGKNPVNLSAAYFSEHSFSNQAAINLPWNVIFSAANPEPLVNPFTISKSEDPEKLMQQFTHTSGPIEQIVKNNRPNIILIVLESFTANVTGCLNGMVQVTPELDKIAEKGILFTQFYASGDRTDKGMLAIISGFPAQPSGSLIKYPEKTASLPSLPKILKPAGYKTFFYYGGDIEFANYKSYLLNAGYEKIVDLHDFPQVERTIDWGVPDGLLFDRIHKDLKNIETPYFLTAFTLSSHPPYDVPMEPHLKGSDDQTLFCNSVYYSDREIGRFVSTLEKEGLLENSLLVFVADHGNPLPGNIPYNYPARYHIPMIWYGGALNITGINIAKLGSQTDFAPTLLAQMKLSTESFHFGKNLFSSDSPQKIVYTINNGFGYISDSLSYYYEMRANTFIPFEGKITKKAKAEGTAYYYTLYNDLISRKTNDKLK